MEKKQNSPLLTRKSVLFFYFTNIFNRILIYLHEQEQYPNHPEFEDPLQNNPDLQHCPRCPLPPITTKTYRYLKVCRLVGEALRFFFNEKDKYSTDGLQVGAETPLLGHILNRQLRTFKRDALIKLLQSGSVTKKYPSCIMLSCSSLKIIFANFTF